MVNPFHLGKQVFHADLGNGAQAHDKIDWIVAFVGRDMDVHAVHPFAFAHLDGGTDLFQFEVKLW